MTAVRRTRAVELMWRAHRWLYRLSGGRVGARLGTLPVLMLTTKGRKTSEPRTVLLTYMADAGCYVVFASHAGEEREPPWWLNLRAALEAEVRSTATRYRSARVRQRARSARAFGNARRPPSRTTPNTRSGRRGASRSSCSSRFDRHTVTVPTKPACPRFDVFA